MTTPDLERMLYTARQTREIDRQVIEQGPETAYQLMQRAGRLVFNHIQRRYGHCQPVVIACGSGNNGGDGYVVARCLQRIGVAVQVLQVAEPSTDSCGQALTDYRAEGGAVTSDICAVKQAGLLVDGMLGAGLSRAPAGRYAEVIAQFNASGRPCVAIDIPSGLDADTGAAFDSAINAALTVTFIARKAGLYTGAGCGASGEVVFESLALDSEIVGSQPAVAELLSPPRLPPRPIDSHKGMFGRVAVVGGEHGMLGAAILAGRAALRSGAGTVTLACRKQALDLAALVQPELMSQPAETVDQIEAVINAADVLVAGPGTDTGVWSSLLFESIGKSDLPRVVDAGALRLLAGSPSLYGQQVLTPHPGEAAALLDCRSSEIQADRLAAAIRICEKYGGICVLKGAGTVISDGRRTAICRGGNPGMASAGMGDVLGGIIGSLMAQGRQPYDAACAGVYLHAEAADQVAVRIGQPSLLASDIIDHLGLVISRYSN